MPKPKRSRAARLSKSATHQDPPAALTPQQMIQIERQRRALTCQAEIQALLKRYNCQLSPQVVISGDKLSSQTMVVALDAPAPA